MDPNFLTSVKDKILTPVEDHLLSHNKIISSLILGNKVSVYTKENGIPRLNERSAFASFCHKLIFLLLIYFNNGANICILISIFKT